MEPEEKTIPNPNEGLRPPPKDLPQKDSAVDGNIQGPLVAKPPRPINLINNYGPTTFGYGTIKEAKLGDPVHRFGKWGALLLVFAVALFAFSGIIKNFFPKKIDDSNVVTNQPVQKKEAPVVLFPVKGTDTWQTYINSADRFSIDHPQNVTEGGNNTEAFPVAVELRYTEPVAEFKIGEEKPGWYLRISQKIGNSKGLSLNDFAVAGKYITTESLTNVNIGQSPAIKWRSLVYPENYYLLDSGDGIFLIKAFVNGQNSDKYLETIDSVLNTFKILAAPLDPDLGFKWSRKQYGDSWNMEVPENWKIDDTGAKNGFISATGEYLGGKYTADFSYPDFTNRPSPGIPDSLEAWVQQDLAVLSDTQRSLVKTVDFKIGDVFGKEVLNYPQAGSGNDSHRLYIWKRSAKNPSLVVVSQSFGDLNSQKMQTLFERLIKGIR